jgi:hypothetical protein
VLAYPLGLHPVWWSGAVCQSQTMRCNPSDADSLAPEGPRSPQVWTVSRLSARQVLPGFLP